MAMTRICYYYNVMPDVAYKHICSKNSNRSINLSGLKVFLIAVLFIFGWQSDIFAWQQGETEAEITVKNFGLGNVCRRGSQAGIQVNINYTATDPVRVMVVLSIPDADGDIVDNSREITLNPGNNPLWLYTPVNYKINSTTIWEVVVYALDTAGNPDGRIGATNIRPATILDSNTSIIGLIGSDAANLELYDQTWPNNTSRSATGYEWISILRGLSPADISDRWMGLEALEALVWTDGDPLQLSLEQSKAIQEWVTRGGHLIIVLPALGDRWKSTSLDPIIPEVNVLRVEDMEIKDEKSAGGILKHLSRFRSTLKRPSNNRPYPRINLHLFEPRTGDSINDWSATDTIPLMEVNIPIPGDNQDRVDDSASRRAVVVQRQVGFGNVTLIGIPITDPRLKGLGLPHTEVFWNQILARRQDTPNRAELQAVFDNKKNIKAFLGSTYSEDLSGPILPMIDYSAQAGGGLLLALVLFIVYWGVSGPGIYTYLKMKGLSRYSWLAFVAMAGLFTAIGWLGAKALRAEKTLPRHVTVIDYITGQSLHRSVTYMTIMLEGYGSRLFTVGDPEIENEPWHNIIHAINAKNQITSTFPDRRSYAVNVSNPDNIDVPARNTVKQLQIKWLGSPRKGWAMPVYTNAEDRIQAIYQTTYAGGVTKTSVALKGKLKHDLPDSLYGVTIYHVTSRKVIRDTIVSTRDNGQYSGKPRLQVYAWSISNPWPSDMELDLSDQTNFKHDSSSIFMGVQAAKGIQNLMDKFPPESALTGVTGTRNYSYSQQIAALDLLSFYTQIKPWRWVNMDISDKPVKFVRSNGREIDISRWLNRPCLIITGYVTGGILPTPIQLDGKLITEVDENSKTFVRWIYPLPVESDVNK